MRRTALSIVVLSSLAACGSSSNDFAAAPVPVRDTGQPLVNLIQGGGYTFSAEIDDTGHAVTEAILIDGLPVQTPPLMGDASFTGRFDMDIMTDIVGAGAQTTGTEANITGPLTLDVSFTDRTVTSRNSDLNVAGTFSGTELSGTVNYAGLEGDMVGGIGARQAIGVFSREAADSIFAGGFYTDDE